MIIVSSLNIWPKENFEVEITNDIDKFKIIGIQAYKTAQTSAFDYVSYKEILNETKKLQSTKTTQENDIPTKVWKKNAEKINKIDSTIPFKQKWEG